ncbi:MAG: BMP family ABC transporter substrate-binding protein, partial [Sphaerochaeta sp.]|nr:BMP family ABC transporter substrate-binding protein [Sphaerochaeta sp.]
MKKFVGFIAMVLIAGLLFAAGSAEATSQESGLNIAIITTPSGVDDGSFNQDNYNGILAFID